jgi:hypothetical protein
MLAAGPKVEGVKFIHGSDKLKPFSSALMTASFPAPFPDATPTHVIRRGVLTCSQGVSDCSWRCPRMCGLWIELQPVSTRQSFRKIASTFRGRLYIQGRVGRACLRGGRPYLYNS